MALTSEEITAKNFKKFYSELLPYLGSYDKGKLTFVGEVKAFFAETAPNGFLICDGATYNKADYPQLANLLLSLTDHSAYEVSGDDTKFKVPDLRGEFLRGSGTNSHANQGSGAGVGVHQDGTLQAYSTYDVKQVQLNLSYDDPVYNSDYQMNRTKWVASPSGSSGSTSGYVGHYTSRPTNTSVLYCIAYKDIMVDLDFLSYGGERFAKSDMYDTNERVIGKWIDGKPLYQKVVDCGALPDNDIKAISISSLNADKIISYSGMASKTGSYRCLPFSGETINNNIRVDISNGSLTIYTMSNWPAYSGFVTLRYTKTTDTADSFKYSTPTDYSTEEKIVGTWIDGKPLYQKTFNLGNLPNRSKKTVAHNISNVDIIFLKDGFLWDASAGTARVLPFVHDTDSANVAFYVKKTNMIIESRNYDWSSLIAYVTLCYTKTTD